jgi:tRNA dimethylallyltransferase
VLLLAQLGLQPTLELPATDQPQLWVVVGATGTGKTELSLRLAEHLTQHGSAAEIVNADAMQLYQGMNIGTAKLPVAQRRGIAHHLFDALHVSEEATVAWYQPKARQTITEILGRGHHAILVGGSGLYVSSVVFDFQFPPRDEALRQVLETKLAAEGVDALMHELRILDSRAAATVDARNPRRVVRALEVIRLGGESSHTLPTEPELWHTPTTILGVHVERAELVDRLDRRVTQMWASGLLDEVQGLKAQHIEQGKTASRAIGYQQALAQLRGDLTQAQAIEQTQVITRRYARRQVSWFKRYSGVQWLESTTAESETS